MPGSILDLGAKKEGAAYLPGAPYIQAEKRK